MKVIKALLATFLAVFTVVLGYWLAGITALLVSVVTVVGSVLCGIGGLALLIYAILTSKDEEESSEDKPKK